MVWRVYFRIRFNVCNNKAGNLPHGFIRKDQVPLGTNNYNEQSGPVKSNKPDSKRSKLSKSKKATEDGIENYETKRQKLRQRGQ